MPLSPGTRLGPYEILSALGAGGMGEVYRATDTNLKRQVAIKVLPESLSSDPERLARFQREAELLAALNHPNIAVIHGLEKSDGTIALVMELVEGEDLSQRIARGTIPLDEALPIAKQIAEALEAAHEQGIIHRDLKPANIKVRDDGTVKVLDFGLAKLTESSALAATNQFAMSSSPTIKSPAPITGVGVLLGTAAYMSPEQARGKTVDKRSDIWAFGCVVYEMLAGQRAFAGNDAADVVVSVLSSQPDWSRLPPQTPSRLVELLNRCLEKDVRERLRDIGDAVFALRTAERDRPVPALSSRSRGTGLVIIGVVAGAVAAAAAAFVLIGVRQPVSQLQSARLSLLPPEHSSFGAVTVSPDGRRVAFTATDASGETRLWIRALDSVSAEAVADTGGANYPFWSPDSRFIGFFADHKVKKVAAEGGAPQTICEIVNDRGGALGGSWNRDGTILFAAEAFGDHPIYQVAATGGEPQPATALTSSGARVNHHHWPSFLPDGRHFLYHGASNTAVERSGIYLGSLDSKDAQFLFRNESGAIYVPDPQGSPSRGYLLYVRERTLMAQPFDLARIALSGETVPIAEGVGIDLWSQAAKFSISQSGVLVYGVTTGATQLTWIDRTGKEISSVGPPGVDVDFRISPDGSRVAAQRQDGSGGASIWLFDIERGTTTRMQSRSPYSLGPVWSPDGRRIAFSSILDHWEIYQASPNGESGETLLFKSQNDLVTDDWSPDGNNFLYGDLEPRNRRGDLLVLPRQRTGDQGPEPVAFARTSFDENFGRFSPDGRWIAYQSDESGRDEIYAKPFGLTDPSAVKTTISLNGGIQPRWPRRGHEIFYIAPDNMLMAVDVKVGRSLDVGHPRPLFPIRRTGVLSYDVTADGQRFLVSVPVEESVATPAMVVLNWWSAFGAREMR